jgi:glycosyltransferase involved in cell wall biosynthesis
MAENAPSRHLIPRVSVVMAAHNAEEYLRPAIDSILGQTLSQIELIVVDDGSTDGTWDILQCYHDPRLFRIKTKHSGLEASLNVGIQCARSELIARMDADDVSLPFRLARQEEFLRADPEVAMVGSFCRRISEAGRDLGVMKAPCSWSDIRRAMSRDNVFIHSTVMVRRSALRTVGLYDPAYRFGDYELWIRIAAAFPVANIPEVLVLRREHQRNMSYAIPVSRSRWERLRVQWKALRSLGCSAHSYYHLCCGLLSWAVARARELSIPFPGLLARRAAGDR